jgi:hypothetical protein
VQNSGIIHELEIALERNASTVSKKRYDQRMRPNVEMVISVMMVPPLVLSLVVLSVKMKRFVIIKNIRYLNRCRYKGTRVALRR